MSKKIAKEIDKNISTIKLAYKDSSDIVTRNININKKKIAYVYLESVSSDDKISDFFMKDISSYVKTKKIIDFQNLLKELQNSIPNSHLTTIKNYNEVFYNLAGGFTIIFIDGADEAISIETRATIDRGVMEASNEKTIRGPRDSFTENNSINLGLIRKRIKDPKLHFKEIIVGKRTKTKVTIAYIEDIAKSENVKRISDKISKINTDSILDTAYLREFLVKSEILSFPRFICTERPDLTSGSLLEGKIAILVENSPYVIILPALIVDFMHTAEDYYQRASSISFTRILRVLAFIITIITPSMYVALTTFNQEIIPNQLLISLAVQKEAVPFPTVVEIFIMIVTFEFLREADIRMPNSAGAAISIVGALVLGEAAVSAGIVSPIVIIIVAISAISGILFTDVDFINAIRLWRFIFLFFGSILGLVGFFVCTLIFIIKLCSIESDNIPYMTPLSPLYLRSMKDSIIRFPRNKIKYRPSYIAGKDKKKLGDNIEE